MAFYMSYLFHISVYSVLIFTIMVTFCKKLDDYLPVYNKDKPRWKTITEIYLQLLMIVAFSYITREMLNYFIKGPLGVVGSPDKFAIIILGSPMFSQQPKLLEKIKNVWSIV